MRDGEEERLPKTAVAADMAYFLYALNLEVVEGRYKGLTRMLNKGSFWLLLNSQLWMDRCEVITSSVLMACVLWGL